MIMTFFIGYVILSSLNREIITLNEMENNDKKIYTD